jgi:hypothetical protein
MATALLHLDAKQKQRLVNRARLRGKSFSQEVRDALDLYLAVPIETEEELSSLARAASLSADRTIRKLDETIEYVDRTLKKARNGR